MTTHEMDDVLDRVARISAAPGATVDTVCNGLTELIRGNPQMADKIRLLIEVTAYARRSRIATDDKTIAALCGDFITLAGDDIADAVELVALAKKGGGAMTNVISINKRVRDDDAAARRSRIARCDFD